FFGILSSIVNTELLLSPLMTQEAVISSHIEGTQATLEEVLEFEASEMEKSPRYDDFKEIINYRQAMRYAAQNLKERPICLNLMLEMHSMLLDSVRGHNKARGMFRTVQNYIGPPGSKLENANYVPPPPEKVLELMSNLEKYIHYEEKDRLVQLAVIHAQFELIHPFVDGNGRLGRILIPIFLFEKSLIFRPVFYISSYFEKYRVLYYESLKNISDKGDWNGWIRFFLLVVATQAVHNTVKALEIISLYRDMKEKIPKITRSQFAIKALDAIFDTPTFTTSYFIKKSGIAKQSAMRLLDSLIKENILSVVREGSGQRARILSFPQLIQITKE
ncbi:MAG: Fic/DOC family N-terminal domain-containing protein, partial [Candidatus Poribacteria bacterium]